MRKIRFLEDVTHYPDGKSAVFNVHGEEAEYPDEHVEMLIAKGHAEEAAGAAEADTVPASGEDGA